MIELVKDCVASKPERRLKSAAEIVDRLTTKPSQKATPNSPSAAQPSADTVIPLIPAPSAAPARPQAVSSERKPGERIEITLPGGVKMAFAWCPPGKFLMGSPMSESGRHDDEHLHEVTLTKGFWTGVYPITVKQFKAFVDKTKYKTEAETSGGAYRWTNGVWELEPQCNWRNPGFAQDDDHPVVAVSWKDAKAFMDWASQETKTTLRFLTEAEWE